MPVLGACRDLFGGVVLVQAEHIVGLVHEQVRRWGDAGALGVGRCQRQPLLLRLTRLPEAEHAAAGAHVEHPRDRLLLVAFGDLGIAGDAGVEIAEAFEDHGATSAGATCS